MANTKISALTALTGANLATNDQFAVVDTSAVATKSITVAELKLGIMPAPGPIGATTPAAGAFTTLNASGTLIANTANLGASGAQDKIIVGGQASPSGPYIAAINSTDSALRPLLVDSTTLTWRSSYSSVLAATSAGLAVTGTISATSIITPGTFTTGTRPAKTLGGIIFDTTLNKLLIGGVSAWEVVTSI